MNPGKQFLAQRRQALIDLDVDFARQLIPHATSDEILLVMLHKIRYEDVSISDVYRIKSYHFLAENGYRRSNGTPLLPLGILPNEV